MTPERLSQVQELYHSTREREPAHRIAFLAVACKGDEELRSEVESLLAASPPGDCFLDEPVMDQAAALLVSAQNNSQARFGPGRELGPYVIQAHLGAGGMGEVYRARDKRLHRMVALKVLPCSMATTPGVRQRLEREAKAISSLNHPRICILYDVGREGDVDYLVMEFLEGKTLAQRLRQGALPFSESLDIASQVASALSAAHTAGIVHRDLKPGNIMLTKSGAKLLDFGLAEVRPETGRIDPITGPGMVAGTVQYMSPEQIHGRGADARSDLFAFGATLYEMLTGQQAFQGNSQILVASAILEHDPPPVSNLQPLTPPALDRVVRRCLAKDPEKRWQNSGDLASELGWIAETMGVSQAGQAVSSKPRLEPLYRILVLICVVVAVITALWCWRLARTPVHAIVAEIALPGNLRLNSASFGGSLAVSPDGRALAFCAADEKGKTLLWVRSLNAFAARSLQGTEGAGHPFWSPDSRRLGFFAGTELKSIVVDGGPAVVLAATSSAEDGGASWGLDGTILFVPDPGRGVYKVAATGGASLPIIAADPRGSGYFAHPRFLPDGKHFLYSYGSGPASGGTYFASLDGKGTRLVLGGNTFAMYASGYLLYVREASLLAQPFDPQQGQLKGEQPQRVGERVALAGGFIHKSFDASESGTLVYRMNSEANEQHLAWFDRSGKRQGDTGEAGDYWDLRLSPNGQKLASNIGSPNSQILVDDLARGVRTRLTSEPDTDHGDPIWSPDGSRLVFAVMGGTIHKGIYQKYSNGTESAELLLSADSDTSIWPTSWSRDGRFLLYSRAAGARQPEILNIWLLPMTGDRKPRVFLQSRAPAYDAQFSPDGKWVAYTSEESGRSDIYIVPFGTAGRDRWQVSASGGRSPRWRRDGKEIFYLSATNQMMAAPLGWNGRKLIVGKAQTLFTSTPTHSLSSSAPYDVSADGKRFVINSFVNNDPSVMLLVNWTANLK